MSFAFKQTTNASADASSLTTTVDSLTHHVPKIGNEVLTFFKSGEHLLLAAGVLLYAGLSIMEGTGKKGKLATGYFGGFKERKRVRQYARKQVINRNRKEVALYIGKPQQGLFGNSDKHTLYLSFANQGIAAFGGSGMGKTSFINPRIYSAIDQGLPIILYDYKFPSAVGTLDGSSQTEQIVGYAKKSRYRINFFAPGFEESDVLNPVKDFLRSESDSENARQLSEIINRNFKLSASNKDDPFFSPAGDQLCEAIFMLAKSTPYPDLMMCQALLSMDNLVARIRNTNINYFIKASFGQLLSSAGSEKTVASIAATASNLFTRFMKPSILSAFCGETNLPLDLKGKQLIVFGMDRARRDVIRPLLALAIEMTVNRNMSQGRTDGMVVSLDEIKTIKLLSTLNWLAENRSEGQVTIIGAQNIVQLEEVYGTDYKSMLGNCATKAWFNPQEYDSAKMFSDYLGDEEIKYKQKSRGRTGGKATVTISEQEKTRKLCEPSRFLKLPRGECILINPGQSNKDEASIPIKQKIKIPKRERQAMDESVAAWKDIRDEHIMMSTQKVPTQADLKERYEAAEALFPLPA